MVKFIMLVGLPRSGKTSYARMCKESISTPTIILSSDAIREELYGDESVQTDPENVFKIMRERTIEALTSGTNVIYDATNVVSKRRKHFLTSIPHSLYCQCEKIACVVWAKYETCVLRDSKCQRQVGEHVIKRMLLNFQPPYYDEGWNKIQFEMTDDLYELSDYNAWLDCNHDNPHHNNTVKEHTQSVVQHMTNMLTLNPYMFSDGTWHSLMLAAQLHDIGKKFTKSFTDNDGHQCDIAHFYSHQNVGSYFAIGLNYESALGASVTTTGELCFIVWLIRSHMEPFFNSKYYRALSSTLKEPLDMLHYCDVEGA